MRALPSLVLGVRAHRDPADVGLCAEDKVLASTGPFFSFGLQGLHAPLSVGACAVLLPEWGRHADFLDAIEAEAVTAFWRCPPCTTC